MQQSAREGIYAKGVSVSPSYFYPFFKVVFSVNEHKPFFMPSLAYSPSEKCKRPCHKMINTKCKESQIIAKCVLRKELHVKLIFVKEDLWHHCQPCPQVRMMDPEWQIATCTVVKSVKLSKWKTIHHSTCNFGNLICRPRPYGKYSILL